MQKRNLIIKLKELKDLLIPPTQDLLSDYDYIQSGEAALPRAIQYINPKEFKKLEEIEIYLPSSVVSEDNIEKIRLLIHRYLHFQMEEDNKKMVLFKHNTFRIFRNAILFLIVCMAIVTIIGMETFVPNLPPLMRSVLVEGFTVVGWVVMWRPIELILNQWTALKIETQIYKKLLEAKVTLNTY